jgi:hypothetical protein
MRTLRSGVGLVTVAFALALPAPASAQIDPGVNYDPASPAGKEYAIPLVLGRAEGAGTEDQQAAANTPFGIGITPRGARGAGDGGAGGGAGGAGGAGAGTAGSEGSAPRGANGGAPSAGELRDRIAAAEAPGGTAGWSLGIWAAVLLGAALVGLLLRGRPVRPAT